MVVHESDQMVSKIVEIARAAGDVALASYTRISTEEVRWKSNPQDLVTEVDRAIEDQVVHALESLTPGANVLGEETGGRNSGSSIRWVIDPIDGTRYFARGLPMYSVTIGMLNGDEPELGVIHLPSARQTFYARRGGGAMRDGQMLPGPRSIHLPEALIYIDVDGIHALDERERAWVESRIMRLLGNCYRVRMFGAASIAATWLAAGALDAFIDLTGRNPLWDMIAARVLMTEAGAVEREVVVADGPKRFVAANPLLLDSIVELLNAD